MNLLYKNRLNMIQIQVEGMSANFKMEQFFKTGCITANL